MNNLAKYIAGLSAAGLVFIATQEDFRATPYLDSAKVWTDGFGNTQEVRPNKPVTVPQALNRLQRNATEAGQAVNLCITAPIQQNQYDAFTSFTFNVGGDAFCKSTLVKKFNAGDVVGACNELLRWVYAGGKRVTGLVRRREAENKLCLGEYQ